MNDNDLHDYDRDLNKLMEVRKEKLKKLQEEGKNPFAITKYDRKHFTKDIIDNFEKYENKDVSIAGRIMQKRVMGKASFINIQDSEGKIQVYVSRDDIEDYSAFKKYDIGDIVGIKGFVFKTKTGEITVHAKSLILLTKSLRPFPEKFNGLKDVDLRYRQRELDLIVNPEVKKVFLQRIEILKEIKNILDKKGYIEVETPILHPILGGAAARPFVTHHNTLDMELYLRIANELYLKRLIVGGFDKVYEMGKMFRNEGMDIKHNPEFTNIELYAAYEDYHDMMDITEEIITEVAKKVLGTEIINYQGKEISLKRPWKRMTMLDAVKKETGIDFNKVKDFEEAKKLAQKLNIEVPELFETKGEMLNLFFEETVEKTLIEPTFILDYPVEVSPLTKRSEKNPELTERFELFINGVEYGNAYSELNDPIDQYERFLKQVEAREKGDDEANMMDEDFVKALEYGMPPTGGLGIGIDRLIMLLTDSASIRDILLFPTMKPRTNN